MDIFVAYNDNLKWKIEFQEMGVPGIMEDIPIEGDDCSTLRKSSHKTKKLVLHCLEFLDVTAAILQAELA